MSFRQDSRKQQKSKTTSRDQRLFSQITNKKNCEERAEKAIEENKADDDIKSDFIKKQEEMRASIKKRIQNLTAIKTKSKKIANIGIWEKKGPCHQLTFSKDWSNLKKHRGRIQRYPGFTPVVFETHKRHDVDKDHEYRKGKCSACFEQVDFSEPYNYNERMHTVNHQAC